jgi:ureidoacrylate peracid hydrolase
MDRDRPDLVEQRARDVARPDHLAGVLRAAHTALVVIDPQHDFCSSEGAMATVLGLDLRPVQQRVPALNALIGNARDAGVPVVWVQEVMAADRMTRHQKRLHVTGDQVWLVAEGSKGAARYSEVVDPLPGERVITKWNYDAFSDTELDLLLRAMGVETIVVAGFTTNVCVETSARHGYMKGYDVVVVSDCTAAPSRAEHDAALHNIRSYFGFVADRALVAAAWTAR